ncbi:hypothetical protein NQ176_g2056 [Zarea fungicola]|uniref:Uncharacterized protein n=1 Tax=Zarea fungicola TaxID=93591 RepID=A0ACC1NPZ7_9HYPO|nr:hypothetical protein NQ176_g2056 [Lecanicillium fungicola]
MLLSAAPSLLAAFAIHLLAIQAEPVQVRLPSGATIHGQRSSSGIDTFHGIPYALPPVGQLRLRPPQRLSLAESDVVDATGKAAACPQLLVSPSDGYLLAKIGASSQHAAGREAACAVLDLRWRLRPGIDKHVHGGLHVG